MPPPTIQHRRGVVVRIDEQDLVSFAGCDYLGLSQHPAVLESLRQGVDEFGLSASASRVTSGSTVEHTKLEQELARFFGRPAAALTADGSLANFAAAQALANDETATHIACGSHPSLEAAFTPIGPLERFDPAHGPVAGSTLVVTDGVFPSSGSIAPLADYLRNLPVQGQLVVDDCHALGVIGTNGRGSCSYRGVDDPRVTVTGTLSKSVGAHGGFVVGETAIIDAVRTSSAYVTATPIPSAIARAARTALALVAEGALVDKLRANVEAVREVLRLLGLPVSVAQLPVFPLESDLPSMRQLTASLQAAGLFVPYIHYPGGPKSGYLRLSISAGHEQEHIQQLHAALRIGLADVGWSR